MVTNDGYIRTLAAIKGGPVTVLLLLCRVGSAVSVQEISAALSMSAPSVRGYLGTLAAYGLAASISGDWQVATAGRQMILGETSAMSDIVGEIAPAQPNQTGEGREEKNIFSSPIILLKEINTSEVINDKKKNSAERKNIFSQATRRGHKEADQSPLSAADEQAIGALVKVGVPRRVAEKSVSASPLSSELICSQALAWVRYRNSPRGMNLRASGFPFLVARRIQDGDLCPGDDGGEAYSGYSGIVSDDQ